MRAKDKATSKLPTICSVSGSVKGRRCEAIAEVDLDRDLLVHDLRNLEEQVAVGVTGGRFEHGEILVDPGVDAGRVLDRERGVEHPLLSSVQREPQLLALGGEHVAAQPFIEAVTVVVPEVVGEQSAGGDIVDLDTKTAVFNSQAGLDAVQLYLDAAKGYEVGPNPLGLATDVGYVAGKAGMIVALPVARVILPALGQTNFGVARMPKHPAHPRENMAAGETLGISPNSEHPWEAWLWIRFLMQYEQQMEFAEMGFAFPALKSAILDLDVTDPMNEAFWLDAQNNEYAKMFYHKANDIDRLVGEMVQAALLTHTEAGFDLQALLDEYAEEATAILQED